MKGIILASGIGRRLQPLTNDMPKALVEVGGKAIIDYQVECLARHGVRDIVVTTGHLREKLEAHVKANRSVSVQFVHNPDYVATNYIYTLWLTRGLINDDVILSHGDLIFESAIVSRLLGATGNRVLVNRCVASPEKDFKAIIKNDRVTGIGVNLHGPDAFFCAPVYRFSKRDFLRWLDRIGDFVRRGRTGCYAEDALNEISDEVLLRPLYAEEFCMEIDTLADLERAREWVERRRQESADPW